MEKENFLKGVVCGIVLSTIAVCITFFVLRGKFAQVQPPMEEYVPNENYTEFENTVVEKMRSIRSLIDKYFLYEDDEEKMLAEISKGILNSLDDPYSTYYDKESFEKMMESTNGSYYGIGVQVSQDVKTMTATIVNIFKNSPAQEAGLKVEDIFVEVDGHDVTQMNLEEIISYIKGEEGTKVPIKIYRPDDKNYYSFDVELRKVEITTVDSKMLDDNIGYIVVSEFDDVTPGQFKTEMDALIKEGMKGVIIDLRNNPGGLLSAVTKMCDYFLEDGLIVYTETKQGNREEFSATKGAYDVPVVILVNGYSASASEIFAGAMKDHDRATLVGTKTYGKGIVQRIIPLLGGDGDAIKITVSSYFTPNGVCIHKVGITPDVVVEVDETASQDVDNQLQEAVKEMKKKLAK